MTIPPADVSWLLLTPLERRGVLARSTRAALAAGAVLGAGLGVVALAVIGPHGALAARLALAILAGRVWRLLPRFPAAAVVESSSRASTVRSATAFLSVSLLAGAAENRYWRRHRLTSRAWPRLPAPAVAAWLDWRRMSRRRLWLAGLMASGVMPAVLGLATGREGWSSPPRCSPAR